MRYSILTSMVLGALATAGCSNGFYGGAAVGAGTAAVAYEVYNHEAMEDLEEAYDAGDISREEYERRKAKIEGRSVVE